VKTCFKCGDPKPLAEFYKHPAMADGHLGKCKACTKKDVATHRQTNLPKIAEYERRRFRDPKRKAKVKQYQIARRLRDPQKYKARQMAGNAIRDGRLKRQPCVYCGNPKSQAHHDDYAKPLDVKWVCFKYHREKEHGQKVIAV
jgi:hypothetical protein